MKIIITYIFTSTFNTLPLSSGNNFCALIKKKKNLPFSIQSLFSFYICIYLLKKVFGNFSMNNFCSTTFQGILLFNFVFWIMIYIYLIVFFPQQIFKYFHNIVTVFYLMTDIFKLLVSSDNYILNRRPIIPYKPYSSLCWLF